MSVLLVVNTAPYGSEGPYKAVRLADALALRGEHAHARVATIHDLAEATVRNDRVVSF